MTKDQYDKLTYGEGFTGAVGYASHRFSYQMLKSALRPDIIRVLVSGEYKHYHYKSIQLPR